MFSDNDEDNLNRELFDLGTNPTREHVCEVLQAIAAEHLAEHAAELMTRVPRAEALQIINTTWLPQLNEWVRDTCDMVMKTLPEHGAPDYADLCLDELRRNVMH